jgi:peroxiredoxin family protein
MQVKHSKYKNTGILFELLVRQITTDTLDGKDSPAKDILKKYFVKTELGREYKLYETLLKKTSLTETKANVVVTTLTDSSKTLNRGVIKRQKYNLISEIQKHYDLNEFFNHKLPNYKVFAAFYTLLEITNTPQAVNPEQTINNKVTILEHLTAAQIKEDKVRDDVMDEFSKADKDVRFIAYKMLLESFNSKYDDLHPNQKLILKEFITSVDNTPRLREFYTNKVIEIKEELTSLNAKTKNEVTKIKINEIISIITPPAKNIKVTDNDLVDLLQYYDLINELETVNG